MFRAVLSGGLSRGRRRRSLRSVRTDRAPSPSPRRHWAFGAADTVTAFRSGSALADIPPSSYPIRARRPLSAALMPGRRTGLARRCPGDRLDRRPAASVVAPGSEQRTAPAVERGCQLHPAMPPLYKVRSNAARVSRRRRTAGRSGHGGRAASILREARSRVGGQVLGPVISSSGAPVTGGSGARGAVAESAIVPRWEGRPEVRRSWSTTVQFLASADQRGERPHPCCGDWAARLRWYKLAKPTRDGRGPAPSSRVGEVVRSQVGGDAGAAFWVSSLGAFRALAAQPRSANPLMSPIASSTPLLEQGRPGRPSWPAVRAPAGRRPAAPLGRPRIVPAGRQRLGEGVRVSRRDQHGRRGPGRYSGSPVAVVDTIGKPRASASGQDHAEPFQAVDVHGRTGSAPRIGGLQGRLGRQFVRSGATPIREACLVRIEARMCRSGAGGWSLSPRRIRHAQRRDRRSGPAPRPAPHGPCAASG